MNFSLVCHDRKGFWTLARYSEDMEINPFNTVSVPVLLSTPQQDRYRRAVDGTASDVPVKDCQLTNTKHMCRFGVDR